jgi:hypothetical protein
MDKRFDFRTLLLIFGAALIGAAWAYYNRMQVTPPYHEDEYRELVWIIFATPFALFWGWFFARRHERWWAAFVCFCIYFFSPFVAARYESCVVVTGSFNLNSCFLATTEAQNLANTSGHVIYFNVIIVIHLIAALAVALHRAFNRSTIPEQSPSVTSHQPPVTSHQ